MFICERWKGTGGISWQVEGESSGAPGGGVAAGGADDVSRLATGKKGATSLNRCPFVSKEQIACLGGETGGSRIGVPCLGVDSAWGDKVVSAAENITFAGNC